MAQKITLRASDGSTVEFIDEVKGSGAMKDVYFSPDKSYVVGFFRVKQDVNAKARLEDITGKFREKLFNQEGGKYWEDFFCWPTKWSTGMERLVLYAQPTRQNSFQRWSI